RRSFEDVWHLLHHGDLPVDDGFARQTARLRELPLDRDLLGHLARRGGTFMSMLQAAISATGAAWGIRPWHERNPDEAEDEALRIATVLPTLVAALWRLRAGHAPVDPDPSLGHAANYLWMLEGVRPGAARRTRARAACGTRLEGSAASASRSRARWRPRRWRSSGRQSPVGHSTPTSSSTRPSCSSAPASRASSSPRRSPSHARSVGRPTSSSRSATTASSARRPTTSAPGI